MSKNFAKALRLLALIALHPRIASGQPEKIDDFVRSQMAARHVPGVSIAVIHKGQLIFARGYGLANVELSVPLTVNGVFKLASLTKPFTATAIMALVQEGKLNLDVRLAEYMPDLPTQFRQVTVRQLLSHTSGLADYLGAPRWSWRSSWRLDLTPDEFIAFASEAPPLFAPGTDIKYSNTGYYLLGLLIERLSGRSYEQFLTERIFQPLKMTASRRDSPNEIIPSRVSGYVFRDSALQNAEYTSATWAYAEGGIISTVLDLAKWDAALYTDNPLRRSTIEQMWTPAKLGDGRPAILGDNGAGKPNYYGLGWVISEHRSHRIVLHTGTKPGFSSSFTRFVDDRLTVIVLCNNSSGAAAFPISLGIADFYLPIVNRRN